MSPSRPAVAVLAEAKAAGVVVWLDGQRLRLRATVPPSRELVERLRAHKPELTALLTGDACRRCGRPMRWPEPSGVVYGDGTAEHHECRLWAAAERALAGVGDGVGELVEGEA